MTQMIPFNKLVPSKLNVRKQSDSDADSQLTASVREHGLLQNLVVGPLTKPKGSFEVLAGNRRYAALKALVEEGVLDNTHPVPCFRIDGDDAARAEASLAENFLRLAMNPADECDAFRHMIELGADAEGIARRFGLTVRFVEGRLRLANLAPVVFEALREGSITLDTAKAYASSSDHERQTQVFAQLSGAYNGGHPETVKRMMTATTAAGSDRRARFVGREAYLAAGGRIECDLFTTEVDDERWLDVAILERLAAEKMEKAAAEVALETGFGWVTCTLNGSVPYDATRELLPVQAQQAELTEEEQQRLDEISGEMDEIADQIDACEDEDAAAELEARYDELESEAGALGNKPAEIPADKKALVGGFVVLDADGTPRLESRVYAREAVEGLTVPTYRSPGRGEASPTVKAAKKAGLSQALVAELAMQRRDLLALHLANDPGMALDFLIFSAAVKNERNSMSTSTTLGTTIDSRLPDDPAPLKSIGPSQSRAAMDALKDGLDRSWQQHQTLPEQFDAFRALADDNRAAWLGAMVARTLSASLNLDGSRRCPMHDHLGQLLDIDVAGWWRPTSANFFDRVPRATMLDALNSVGGINLSSRYANAKKAELSQACERIFSGQFIEAAEIKDAAIAWVPGVMRFATADEPPASLGDTDADEVEPENGADYAGAEGDEAKPDEAEVGLEDLDNETESFASADDEVHDHAV